MRTPFSLERLQRPSARKIAASVGGDCRRRLLSVSLVAGRIGDLYVGDDVRGHGASLVGNAVEADPSQALRNPWLKLESALVDTHAMEDPRQIDGTWWQRSGDVWFRWSTGEQKWEQQNAAPPDVSPAETRTAPAATAVATIESRPEVDAKDPGETWAAVKVTGEQLRQRTSEASWGSPPPKKPMVPLLVAAAVIVLVAALGFGAYVTLFKSNVPSDEEIDAAFGSPRGYSYEEWPPEAKDLAEKAIAGNPEMADLELRFDGRMVTRDGVPLGTVVIIGTDPAELEGLDKEFLPIGEEASSNVSLDRVSRGGTEMYEIKLPQGGAAVFLDPEDGLVVAVAARDVASMQDISAQLAETNI